MYTALKLLHVLSAIWLLSGMLARPIVLAAARVAPDIKLIKAIADVSGRLEDRMIAPGFPAVIVTGIATALAGSYSLFGPFTGGPWWVFLSLLLMALVIVIFPSTLRHDHRFGQDLEESARAGAVTERLRHFLTRDAMVRRYAPDLVLVLAIVVLMVTKPF